MSCSLLAPGLAMWPLLGLQHLRCRSWRGYGRSWPGLASSSLPCKGSTAVVLLTLSATHGPGLSPTPHTHTQQVVCSCRHRGPHCGGTTVWHCGIAPAPIHRCCMRTGGAVRGLGCRHGWLCHRPVVQCRTSHDHQRQVSCCVPSDFCRLKWFACALPCLAAGYGACRHSGGHTASMEG